MPLAKRLLALTFHGGPRERFGNFLVAALAILLIVQIWTISEVGHAATSHTVPVIGQILPRVQVAPIGQSQTMELSRFLATHQSCTLLVAISTSCPICARMRIYWKRRFDDWYRSASVNVVPIWLSAESEEAITTFVAHFDLQGVYLLRVSDEPELSFARLGVYGTPTSYLLDASGRLRYGVAGDQFPPTEVATAYCAGDN